MNNIIEEFVDLEIRKRELEKDERIILLLKLVDKYNTYYSNKCDVEEALMFERLIGEIKSIPKVTEYFQCVDSINELLEHIYFEQNGEGYNYIDLSTRKFILFKNR